MKFLENKKVTENGYFFCEYLARNSLIPTKNAPIPTKNAPIPTKNSPMYHKKKEFHPNNGMKLYLFA